jgi:hypothetical protein
LKGKEEEGGVKLGQNPGRAKFREIPIKEKRALVYFLLSMLELYYFLGSKVASSSSGGRKHRVASTA